MRFLLNFGPLLFVTSICATGCATATESDSASSAVEVKPNAPRSAAVELSDAELDAKIEASSSPEVAVRIVLPVAFTPRPAGSIVIGEDRSEEYWGGKIVEPRIDEIGGPACRIERALSAEPGTAANTEPTAVRRTWTGWRGSSWLTLELGDGKTGLTKIVCVEHFDSVPPPAWTLRRVQNAFNDAHTGAHVVFERSAAVR